jgi:uncharacterized membrane protein HdeD (DUF308 family)
MRSAQLPEQDNVTIGVQYKKQSLKIFMDSRSRKTVIISSIVFLLTGIAGIALPQFMSTAIAIFAGWLMIIAGGIYSI